MKKIVLILSSLFLYGCGTLTTLKDPCPYIGTRYDYNMVVGNFYDGVGFKHMTRPFYLIDWPVSFIVDTALLPINIPRYYSSDEEVRASCGQYGDPNNKHLWIKKKEEN